MNNDVIEVQVRAVLPLEGSYAVFLGTAEKTFVIYVDETVGAAISMFMRQVPKERPLTHDLVGHILLAFGARVDRVVINNINGSVFYARLILSAENQLHSRKLVELDARPSDCIALATQAKAPLLVSRHVWENVEDVSDTLATIEEQGGHTQSGLNAAAAHEGGKKPFSMNAEEQAQLEKELFGEDDLDFFDDEDDEDDEDDDDELEDDLDEDDDDDDIFGFAPDDDDEGDEWKKS
jgi:uncharacterized protein